MSRFYIPFRIMIISSFITFLVYALNDICFTCRYVFCFRNLYAFVKDFSYTIIILHSFSFLDILFEACYDDGTDNRTAFISVCSQTTIIHLRSGLCLDSAVLTNNGIVFLANCTGAASQEWVFKKYFDLTTKTRR